MNHDKLTKCPFCGKSMDPGWVWVSHVFAGSLMWSAERPSLAVWKPDSGETVFHSTCFNPQGSVRRGYRCSECMGMAVQPDMRG